jgi:hypothetical protein
MSEDIVTDGANAGAATAAAFFDQAGVAVPEGIGGVADFAGDQPRTTISESIWAVVVISGNQTVLINGPADPGASGSKTESEAITINVPGLGRARQDRQQYYR